MLRQAIDYIKSKFSPAEKIISIDDLAPYNYNAHSGSFSFDGDKFLGGFGETKIFEVDYWTLRARSEQLFKENLYARGFIRRLITNEINTGLCPEMVPMGGILGISEDALNDWSDDVENRFKIWADNPKLCDFYGVSTFAELQKQQRQEALVAGDVLIVLHIDKLTSLPKVQIIPGSNVRTPMDKDPIGKNEIFHGVETSPSGKVVAYWIEQADGESKRILATGTNSGRRIAWLRFGTDKRLNELRGQPILSLILQSLKEIDRYRDAVQRKAVINATLAMFIEKTEDKPGTLPITGGAKRKTTTTVTDSDGSKRNFRMQEQLPGVVFEELQQGERPVGFNSQGIDLNFGLFETAIIQSVAWANEVPPEILTLAFSSNYSASAAAILEFRMYLNKRRGEEGEQFCKPINVEWLLGETLTGRIKAPGLIESWRDPLRFDEFGAWVNQEWYGSIKPSTDPLKQAKASEMYVKNGWSTNAKESREVTGTKFSHNVARLKRENRQLMEAKRPIAEFNQEFNVTDTNDILNIDDLTDNIVNAVNEELSVGR